MAEKKTETKSKAAKSKKAEPKPKKEKAPRESREGWGTFALRMPVGERDAFHKAAGAGGASRFARALLLAFSNGDEAAFKNAVKAAREARQ